MSLAMSRPWKHPKTGVYWLRKRVPKHLRRLVGRGEEKRSLRTKDPSQAKTRFLDALSEIETQWNNLLEGPRVLSEQECHELARTVHDRFLEKHRANPSEPTFWNVELGAALWERSPPPPSGLSPKDYLVWGLDQSSFRKDELKNECIAIANQIVAANRFIIDDGSRQKLAKAVAAALQRASAARQSR